MSRIRTHETAVTESGSTVRVPIADDRVQIVEAFEYASLVDPPPHFARALQRLADLEAEGKDARIHLRGGKVVVSWPSEVPGDS